MKTKLAVAAIIICCCCAFAAPKTGEDVLKLMYNRYAGKWHRTLTFQQKTEVYRNDSLIRTQTWHEAMLAPDKLRIDIEPLDKDNSIIFRGDSTYRIVAGKIRSAVKDENDLIFLLGGMYFYSWDKTVAKLKDSGYDLSKAYETEWKGKPAYVIGAASKDDITSNQLWIDKKDLYLVRILENHKDTKEECIFENHVKIGGGWSETKASFYFNNKLVQVETYTNSKETPTLTGQMFDPQHFVKMQW